VRLGELELGRRPCIVAAGGEAEVGALAAAADADAVELRADLFAEPTVESVTAALGRLRAAGRPIVLTVRAADEGGRAMPEERRAAIYAAGLPHVQAIDVEIASTALVHTLAVQARASGRTVILSAHDFTATPPRDRLLALVDRGFAAGADVVKLATHAAGADELRVLMETTLAARPRPIATLAMGPMGPLSRLVLPAAGSLLTYASVGAPTAPGQVPIAELAALVRRFFPDG
jgi:3-dehydroquinate dehydratase I